MTHFENDLAQYAKIIENKLDEILSVKNLSEEALAPSNLVNAMRHGALNGGKRLRPFLLSQSAAIFDVPSEKTIIAGLALEMIHCYSLIHDDLPSMDDDDLRRGKPSVHKAYGEANAILAGDNLLTLAFEILATIKEYSPTLRTRLIAELAKGAGSSGMVGGQVFDLEGENKNLNQKEIANIGAMKTGALIKSAIKMGAMIGDASNAKIMLLSKYGDLAGRAFQLADDILDETASAKQMGKKTNKDADRGKSTLISLIGLKAAQDQLEKMIEQAISTLDEFDEKANGLRNIVRFFGARRS